ncbi:MAG TPA: hypothetical protein VFX30_03780 [bacterium]|nr:hypothetical protein [bacterium]
MINGLSIGHPLLSRYAALQTTGIMNLMRSGGLGEMRTLEPQVTRLFEEGGVDFFIQTRAPHPFLAPLPHALALPPSLALQGRWQEAPRIDARDGSAYVHLSRFVCPQEEISEAAIEAAFEPLSLGTAILLSSSPIGADGNFFLLPGAGGARAIAARDRGDTHLLVKVGSARVQGAEARSPFELAVAGEEGASSREDIYRRLIAKWERLGPVETLHAVERGSAHPTLLREFHRLAELDRHPQAARALFFLEMICRTGFARAGARLAPTECLTAVVGFGDELETIRVLLDNGYPVLAVEDFETPVSSSGRPDITREWVKESFRDHPYRDRLSVHDFRDPQLPRETSQVVLFAAVVDEALPTFVHLVRPGGIAAVTDVGQLGWRRQNFLVDTPESFADAAKRHHGAAFSRIHSDVLLGTGALRSHFIHPLGHRAYIVRREP